MSILNKTWYAKLHVILARCDMQPYAYSVYQNITYMYIKCVSIIQGGGLAFHGPLEDIALSQAQKHKYCMI